MSPVFPDGFRWGAATSAYQIEGSPEADGKGPSIWDAFCAEKGRIKDGTTGAAGCDHYRRVPEDVALMTSLGLKAYRFSVSWPRVMPDGEAANERGLAFYDRLVDALLAAGIEPWLTLYHWDMPLALGARGGWRNREIADRFAAYADAVAARLGDRVARWITLNEPQCFINDGYHHGVHAPGERLDLRGRAEVHHHALLAHGRAVRAIRAAARRPVQVGLAPVGAVCVPATDAPEDAEAARRITFREENAEDGAICWLLDPVFFGRYPEAGWTARGDGVPEIRPGDMEEISAPLDFLGTNIYGAWFGRMGESGPESIPYPVGFPMTVFNWAIVPECLYWGPRFYHERYGVPIAVTENGISNVDFLMGDGAVHDPQRIDFLDRYIGALLRATVDGVPVLGYFHWSLMDNFEWAEGHRHRFGLVHVDFASMRRTPKDSAAWFAEVIRTNGASLGAYRPASAAFRVGPR